VSSDDPVDTKLNEMVETRGHNEHTLDEIAEYCGLSKQAVHQIQNRALRKLANEHWDLRKEWFWSEESEPSDVHEFVG